MEETRKYYDMYNTLDTTLGFLQKEVKLLNSISENFHEAMKSAHSKGEFSKQFETIVHGVEVRYTVLYCYCLLFIVIAALYIGSSMAECILQSFLLSFSALLFALIFLGAI